MQAVLLFALLTLAAAAAAANPCCSFPCRNQGVCLPEAAAPGGFTCDCATTGYYGNTCETPTWGQWFSNMLTPSASQLDNLRGNYKPMWDVINYFPWLHRFVLRTIVAKTVAEPIVPASFDTSHPYKTWEGLFNTSYYGRLLAPIPADCPTPMGTVGPKTLPDPQVIVDTFLKRREFIACKRNTSLILAYYAQHFTHQFFKSKPGHLGQTWSHHYIDMSQVYGRDQAQILALRELKGGRMKMSKGKFGDDLPPLVSQIDDLPHDLTPLTPQMLAHGTPYIGIGKLNSTIPAHLTFALGHPFFSISPFLTVYSTIWLREHNRLAAKLEKAHPDWDDERIYQTVRMINIINCMRLTVSDYVGDNLAKGHFKFNFIPDLMHDQPETEYHNRISIEFNHLYHWHAFLPDNYYFGDKVIPENEMVFNNNLLDEFTIEQIIDQLSRQHAGQPNGANFGAHAAIVAKRVIQEGRELRLQSLNSYRELVGLPAYKTFEEMTSNPEFRVKLKELYEHVDAVEFFPGLFIEDLRPGGLFGPTISQRGVPSTFQGVFGHPLLSPKYYRPSTFGGGVGWEEVNIDMLTWEDIVQRNTKGNPRAQMRVPSDMPATKPSPAKGEL